MRSTVTKSYYFATKNEKKIACQFQVVILSILLVSYLAYLTPMIWYCWLSVRSSSSSSFSSFFLSYSIDKRSRVHNPTPVFTHSRLYPSSSSSSSSSSAPISDHSRLHKLTPLSAILCTHPRCVETKVMGPKVEFYCTEPCPPWSTCPASPIRWRTIDGCSKDARVVLWWVGSSKMSEQTKSSFGDNWGDCLSADSKSRK